MNVSTVTRDRRRIPFGTTSVSALNAFAVAATEPVGVEIVGRPGPRVCSDLLGPVGTPSVPRLPTFREEEAMYLTRCTSCHCEFHWMEGDFCSNEFCTEYVCRICLVDGLCPGCREVK